MTILVKPILASVLPVIPDSTATILVLAQTLIDHRWIERRLGAQVFEIAAGMADEVVQHE